MAKKIYKVHKFGEDPCQLVGVKERAEVLAKGNERERQVGKRILQHLSKTPKVNKRKLRRPGKSAGIDERIQSLEKRLGRVK